MANESMDFGAYCRKCINDEKQADQEPCNSCLHSWAKQNGGKPVFFKKKESKNMTKRFGKLLNPNEEVKEKLDWLFTGFNQVRSLANDNHEYIEKIRGSVKDLSRNIESHKGRLDGIDERLEEIIDRIGDYERERYEKMVEEAKEKVDECEQELNDLDASESELRIRELERELELIKNNEEVYNLGYQAGYNRAIEEAY